MPWSVGDVDSHKKGLTPAQKKKWVGIANGVLKDCQSKGGKDCEGKAIRIANSSFSMEVVMKKETQKIPEAALHFVDHNCFAAVHQGKEGEKVKLDMVAYSGGIIKGHFWWGDLAIDVSGMKFPKEKYPILEAHDTNRKIAFTSKPLTEGNKLSLDPDKVEFMDTPYAQEFIKLSKAGFPYESSIYAVPTSIERLEEGASAEVNGFTLKGPGTVWRQSVFKEASVCVFGYDSNTRSAALSKEIELDVDVASMIKLEEKEVKSEMITLVQFKAESPEAYKELVEQIRLELQSGFDKAKSDLEAKFDQEKTKLQNEMAVKDAKILEMEKADAIRAENEIKAKSESIWTATLTESNIPVHLHDKVKKHVSHSQFVKDGVFDEAKFKEAIQTEIKDWESKGVTSKVLGSSFSSKNETQNSTGGDVDVEGTTNRLLKLAGQKVK